MIKSFRNKGLRELFLKGKSSKVRADLRARSLVRLDVVDHAEQLAELDVPGFDFHRLRGKPKRFSIHVNGPWCIKFEWINGDAWRVDLEQYY